MCEGRWGQHEFGVVETAAIRTYGDTTHSFINRDRYKGVFAPGFKPIDPERYDLSAVGRDFWWSREPGKPFEASPVRVVTPRRDWGPMPLAHKYKSPRQLRWHWTPGPTRICRLPQRSRKASR